MVVPRDARHFYYDPTSEGPDGQVRLVADFLDGAWSRFRVKPLRDILERSDWRAALEQYKMENSAHPAALLIADALLARSPPSLGGTVELAVPDVLDEAFRPPTRSRD
jgi:hypothetical protein